MGGPRASWRRSRPPRSREPRPHRQHVVELAAQHLAEILLADAPRVLAAAAAARVLVEVVHQHLDGPFQLRALGHRCPRPPVGTRRVKDGVRGTLRAPAVEAKGVEGQVKVPSLGSSQTPRQANARREAKNAGGTDTQGARLPTSLLVQVHPKNLPCTRPTPAAPPAPHPGAATPARGTGRQLWRWGRGAPQGHGRPFPGLIREEWGWEPRGGGGGGTRAGITGQPSSCFTALGTPRQGRSGPA